jgi:hypothetical protein
MRTNELNPAQSIRISRKQKQLNNHLNRDLNLGSLRKNQANALATRGQLQNLEAKRHCLATSAIATIIAVADRS